MVGAGPVKAAARPAAGTSPLRGTIGPLSEKRTFPGQAPKLRRRALDRTPKCRKNALETRCVHLIRRHRFSYTRGMDTTLSLPDDPLAPAPASGGGALIR